MENLKVSDLDRLWNRLGLAELRQGLKKIGRLSNRFEQSLAELPSCDKCAQVVLIERIKEAGNKLSGEVVSLTALAETLRSVIAVTEKTHEQLMGNEPHPCRCSEDECKCHDEI